MWCICVDHIQLWAVAVCKSENIVLIMRTAIQSVIIDNNFQFSGLGLSQREMSRTTVSQVAIYKIIRCVHESSSLTQGYVGTYWRQSHKKSCLSTHLEAEEFSRRCPESGWSYQANWTPCRFPHGPRTFSSVWISLKTSRTMPQTDSSSSLPPTHVGKHAPKLKPSALASSDIWWWVQGKPLPFWSS